MYIRKVQRVNQSLYVNLPISMTRELDIESGDKVRITVSKDTIIIRRMAERIQRPQFIERNPDG